MDTQPSSAPKRTRRSDAQWQAILSESSATNESVEQLAERLGCKPSTVEIQLKKLKRAIGTGVGRFVEVDARNKPCLDDAAAALSVQTTTGAIVTFRHLPPPEYLAAALGLAR